MATGLGDLKKRPIPRPVRADGGAVKVKHEIVPPHRVSETALPPFSELASVSEKESLSIAVNASELSTAGVQEAPYASMDNSNLADFKASEKPDTNPTPTRHSADPKLDTEGNTTRHQLDTEKNHVSGFTPVSSEIKVKPDTNPTLTRHPTQHKTRHNFGAQLDTGESLFFIEDTLISLPFSYAQLFNHICEKLDESREASLLTSYKVLARETNLSEGSVRTTMKDRLRKKYNLLSIEAEGGGPQAKIKVFVDQSVLRVWARVRTKMDLTRHQPDTQLNTEPDTSASSKLVNYNNITNTKEDLASVFNDYDQITLPRGLSSMGIYKKQIDDVRNQLRASGTIFTAGQFQEFIDLFEDYIKTPSNREGINAPRAFFCKKAVAVAKGVENAQEIFSGALTQADRDALEAVKRLKAEAETKAQIEKEFLDSDFVTWEFELSYSQKAEILGEVNLKLGVGADVSRNLIFKHFCDHEWPKRRDGFLDQIRSKAKKISQNREVQAEAEIEIRAENFMKQNPKWVANMATTHGILGKGSPEEQKQKLMELARKAATVETGRG